MGDQLSGPGAPQGETDKRHYVYSGIDLGQKPSRTVACLVSRDSSGRLTVNDYLAHERADAVAREPYQREILEWLARGDRVYPLALPRSRPCFLMRCDGCCEHAASVTALRELCACPELKPLPGRPLVVRKMGKP